MPADPIMIEEAKEEGVRFRFLAQPKSFECSDKNHVVVATWSWIQCSLVSLINQEDDTPRQSQARSSKCSVLQLY